MLYRSSSSSAWEDERGAEKAKGRETETKDRQLTAGGLGQSTESPGAGKGADDPHRKDRQPERNLGADRHAAQQRQLPRPGARRTGPGGNRRRRIRARLGRSLLQSSGTT